MFKPKLLLIFHLILLCCSCKTDNKYSYAIKDFKSSLQPHLIDIVSKGIVMYYDSSLRHMAADKELMQLSSSEHPVLRASAFREILQRTSLNHFQILMAHHVQLRDPILPKWNGFYHVRQVEYSGV